MSYYDAYTETDLEHQLLAAGYVLHYTPDENQLELFECGGGHSTTRLYWEKSTEEIFDSIQEAHAWVLFEIPRKARRCVRQP